MLLQFITVILLQSDNSLAAWEGLYTEILNYFERPNTTFPVTIALLKLLKRAFEDKNFVANDQYLSEVLHLGNQFLLQARFSIF